MGVIGGLDAMDRRAHLSPIQTVSHPDSESTESVGEVVETDSRAPCVTSLHSPMTNLDYPIPPDSD
jgi:hypothetical protein